MGMMQEFKEFAMKGSMVDMAVGIIIGAAFGTVVKSLVDDVLMPIVSAVFGSPDFSNLFAVLRNPSGGDYATLEQAREAGAAALGYGLFINAIIAFVIIAFVLFLIIKNINNAKKAEEAAPPAGPSSEDLLTEIRDLLARS